MPVFKYSILSRKFPIPSFISSDSVFKYTLGLSYCTTCSSLSGCVMYSPNAHFPYDVNAPMYRTASLCSPACMTEKYENCYLNVSALLYNVPTYSLHFHLLQWSYALTGFTNHSGIALHTVAEIAIHHVLTARRM